MSPTNIDRYHVEGKQILEEKINSFVSANETIDFAMLGYPMKSQNTRDKTLGIMPDFAEEISFKNFKDFGDSVKQVYSPGVNITLVSDGYVFNDVLGVSDKVVALYEEQVRDMSKTSPITWYNMNDFYPRKLSNDTVRRKISDNFGITSEELERRRLFNPDTNALYTQMIRFMEEEFAAEDFPSRNQLHKKAKEVAKIMMFRNEAYSALVSNEFKDSIRISMHPTTNVAKYGFQLIPSKKAFRSPWHTAILIDEENEYQTVHRREAVEKGYELIFKHGRPYFFKQ